jgi:drug/metabolite transporter (DMT)-like permease
LGSVVVALADSGSGGALFGNLLAVGSALFMAICTMLGAVCRRTLSTTIYTFLIYLFAELTVLVIALAGGTPLFGYESVNFLTTFAMAIFCNLLGHSVFSWGLKYLPPAFISTVKLLEPYSFNLPHKGITLALTVRMETMAATRNMLSKSFSGM